MRNIVVVEAVSTGYNLIEDVRRRGYHPVVLECPGEETEDNKKYREDCYALFHSMPEVVKALDDYTPEDYLDKIFGQHETDSMLDAYLDPEGFVLKAERLYRPFRKGVQKFIMVPKDMEVENHPVWVIAKQLRSTYRISAGDGISPVSYGRTRDLETAGGTIYLVDDDEEVVMSDLAILRETEKKFFSLLLNEGMSRRWFKDSRVAETDFDAVIRDLGCHGAILVSGDEDHTRDGVRGATPETLDTVHPGFDCVIIGYQTSLLGLNESACLDLIFKTIDMVKPGGQAIIPRGTYEYLSYKREGAELLMRIKNLAIQVPLSVTNGHVIGVKES